eukprot:364935-Chlamydomonas_euryale.AAC.9
MHRHATRLGLVGSSLNGGTNRAITVAPGYKKHRNMEVDWVSFVWSQDKELICTDNSWRCKGLHGLPGTLPNQPKCLKNCKTIIGRQKRTSCKI